MAGRETPGSQLLPLLLYCHLVLEPQLLVHVRREAGQQGGRHSLPLQLWRVQPQHQEKCESYQETSQVGRKVFTLGRHREPFLPSVRLPGLQLMSCHMRTERHSFTLQLPDKASEVMLFSWLSHTINTLKYYGNSPCAPALPWRVSSPSCPAPPAAGRPCWPGSCRPQPCTTENTT